MTQRRWFRRGDAIPVVGSLLLAAVLLVIGLHPRTADHAVVQTPQGTYRLALSSDSTQVFEGKDGLSVTVTVTTGRVSVTQADCDDQVCVHTGTLGGSVRAIACVPAGIVVTLEADGNAPDAVTR